MPRGKRSFDPEFRKNAIKLYENGGKTIPLLAQDLGIGESTLSRWIYDSRKIRTGGTKEKLSPKQVDEAFEMAKLKKENSRLREEVDILKKATAFFAKNQ